MSTDPVTSIATRSAQVAVAPASVTASLSAAQEETNESPAATRQEAAQGDAVAIRRVARNQHAKRPQKSAPAREPGKGELVDRSA